MRYIINQKDIEEAELILNYQSENEEVKAALLFMERCQRKLLGKSNGESLLISPEEILYVEKVDDKTFVYTESNELQVDMSLYSLELFLDSDNYFRCSKSMIINISKVERLKSLPSNRIDCTLQNGEHIIISRTYASDFRKLLKGERA